MLDPPIIYKEEEKSKAMIGNEIIYKIQLKLVI